MHKDEYDAFEKLGFFEGLEEETRKKIGDSINRLSVGAGELLFRQGDTCDAVYCVIDGVLDVSVAAEDGGEKILASVEAGEPVGELQILTGGNRTATVRAQTAAVLASLKKELFLEPAYRELASNLEKLIGRRLRHYRLDAVLTGLFGRVEDEVIKQVELAGKWCFLRRGEYLCKAGEQDRSLYLLLSGRLVAATTDRNGRQKIIGEISAGESVGEMALFTGESRSADVVAIRDSELVMLSESGFRELFSRYSHMAIGLTKVIIARLREAVTAGGAPRGMKNICLLPVSKSVSIDEVSTALRKAVSDYCSVYYLNPDTVDRDLRTPGIAQINEEDPARIRLATYFNELESRYDIVLYGADENAGQWSRWCLRQADRLLLVADSADKPSMSAFEATLPDNATLAAPGKSLVMLHKTGKTVPMHTDRWLEGRDVDVCHHVKKGDEKSYGRLARIITGNAVGVVLSGGGAKGYAHAGVLKALEEAGIEVDMIGGTSIGSVISAGYASGLKPDEIIESNAGLFQKFDPFREYTLPIISVLGGRKLDAMFKDAFGGTNIEDLWLNYFCVSSDLTNASERVHKRGPLWKAVRASMSLPGILVPVVEDGNLLVDGGVVNNLPGDVMKSMCRGTVITVDVAPKRDLEFDKNETAFPSPWKVVWSRINPFMKKLRPPTILQILGRSTMLASVHNLLKVTAESRYHLEPPVQQFGMLETDKAVEIAEVGYRYAKDIVAGWSELRKTV